MNAEGGQQKHGQADQNEQLAKIKIKRSVEVLERLLEVVSFEGKSNQLVSQ